MQTVKRFLHFLLSYAVQVLAATLVGMILLAAVYLLPTYAMQENMVSSVETILSEGEYPQIYSWCTSLLDNYTDSIILMNAAYDSGDSPLLQAMTVARPTISSAYTPVGVLRAHYQDGIPYDSNEPYLQYWHGYLLLIKPLLLLMDYSEIRILNGIVQLTLLVLLVFLMIRKGMVRYVPAYLLSYLFLMPVALSKSLQFSSCYFIFTIGCIFLLLRKEKAGKEPDKFFLFLGIATAYFDFLTYPLATLCIPLTFNFCLHPKQRTFFNGANLCGSWAFGYVGMWSGKWIIGSIITGQDILDVASRKLTERSTISVIQAGNMLQSIRDTYYTNIKAFVHTPAILIFFIMIIVLLVVILRKLSKYKLGISAAASVVFPYFVLAALPFAWYLVTANHSLIHYWFTYKALCGSVFAILCALISLCNELCSQHQKAGLKWIKS